MGDGIKYNIDEVAEDGEPIAPVQNARKFINQCRVIVRDNIPITIREWNKPKEDRGVSYVDERSKNLLWDTLMSHFNLPEGLTDGQRLKVKQFALKKMATQFQTWKKRLYSDYLKAEKKTPEFTGALEKIKDHWDVFVKYKESDEAKERSRKNKINAAKKEYHHVLGTGGYKRGVPKWEAVEAKMLAEGVIPAK